MSPVSYASVTPSNFELTPCRVTFKGVDIGATLGNVVVKTETSLSDLKADQYGSTVLDRRTSGHKVTIETEFAEVRFKDNWKILFPMHKLVTQGSSTLFLFDSQIGASQLSFAGELVLHPLSLPDSDKSEDFLIYLATAQGKADYSHSPTEQVKLKCTWDMYPDFSTLPPRFYIFGDPSVGAIPATAGAATAGTGNTGNGTVSGIAVYSGTTVTETITLSCVTPGLNDGTFYVQGSQSGALGLASVGTTFNSDVISFTINDGTTDFVTNDNFAISTTAANYN